MINRYVLFLAFSIIVGSSTPAFAATDAEIYTSYLTIVGNSFSNEAAHTCPCPTVGGNVYTKYLKCVENVKRRTDRGAKAYVRTTPALKRGAVGATTTSATINTAATAYLATCSVPAS